jgi:hypothetical protein
VAGHAEHGHTEQLVILVERPAEPNRRRAVEVVVTLHILLGQSVVDAASGVQPAVETTIAAPAPRVHAI